MIHCVFQVPKRNIMYWLFLRLIGAQIIIVIYIKYVSFLKTKVRQDDFGNKRKHESLQILKDAFPW